VHHVGAHVAVAVAPGTFRPGCQIHGKIAVRAVEIHNIYKLFPAMWFIMGMVLKNAK